MTEQENIIRHRWLIATIGTGLFPLLVLFTFYAWGIFNAVASHTIDISPSVLISLLFTCVGIYCAYKKPGTVYLFLSMLVGPYAIYEILRDWITLLNLPSDPIISSLKLVISFLIVLYMLLYSLWYYYSYHLYKMNKQIQTRIVLKSEQYQQASAVISETINVEDLDQKYYQILSENSSRRFIEEARKLYAARKLMLENTLTE